MTAIDWIFIGLYFVVIIFIGVQTTRKIENSDDFAVAGNRLAWPILFATIAATAIGAGSVFGNAGSVFEDGYVFLLAFYAFALQTVLVGYFVAPRLKRYAGAQTVGDVMDEHYGRKTRLLTGIFSLGLLAGALAAQVLALGTIFNTILGVSPTVGILIGMGVTLLYSTTGGMWAVAQTEVVQFSILGIFVPVALIIGLIRVGGPAELLSSVPDTHFSFLGTWTGGLFISTFLAFLLGETLIPPYAQRAFSAPDSANARKGYTLAGVFIFAFLFVSASLGLVALALFPDIQPDQAVATVVQNVLPIGVAGLVVAALLAVVMSSASSTLNSSAVVFAKDIYLPFINANLSESRKVWLERVATVITGIGATIFALSVPSIIDALLYAYAFWAPTVVIPLLLAVMWGFRSEVAALSAIVSGGVATAVWTWGLNEPFGLTGLVAGVAANIIAFIVAYSIFDKTRSDKNGSPST